MSIQRTSKLSKESGDGLDSTFRGRLRLLSLAIGSVTAVASTSGLSRLTLYSYLNGESCPSLANLSRIAESLGIEPGWLAFGVGRRPDLIKLASKFATLRAKARLAEDIAQ